MIAAGSGTPSGTAISSSWGEGESDEAGLEDLGAAAGGRLEGELTFAGGTVPERGGTARVEEELGQESLGALSFRLDGLAAMGKVLGVEATACGTAGAWDESRPVPAVGEFFSFADELPLGEVILLSDLVTGLSDFVVERLALLARIAIRATAKTSAGRRRRVMV